MSDTQKDSQASADKSKKLNHALTHVKGIPHWDIFADEVLFPLIVEKVVKQRKRDVAIVVGVRQHTDSKDKLGFGYECKQVLRNSLPDIRMDAGAIEMATIRDKPAIQFIDAHVARVLGLSVAKTADQIDWLNHESNTVLKIRAYREGIQGIEVTEDELQNLDDLDEVDDTEDDETFDVTLEPDVMIVPLQQMLFNPDKSASELIKMEHNCVVGSYQDFLIWKKARKSSYKPKKRLLKTEENYDVLEKLYKKIIRNVTGMVFKGTECTEATKSDWINFIPLEHKLLVLEYQFGTLDQKKV